MITENYQVVSPAYGKDFSNAADAKSAFLSGKDFKMESLDHGGSYCSVKDFAKGVTVEVRYAKKSKFVMVKVS